MLELIMDNVLSNCLGISLKEGNVQTLFTMLTDLQEGKKILLSKDFHCSTVTAPPDFPRGMSAYGEQANGYSYLALEVPDLRCRKDEFKSFCEHTKTKLPKAYAKVLSFGLDPAVLYDVFARRSVFLFTFKNDVLQTISSSAYGLDLSEYKNRISVRNENLTAEEIDNINSILSNKSVSLFAGNSPFHSSYYNNYYNPPAKITLFVKANYFRINAYEFVGDTFSLLIPRKSLIDTTYKTNQHIANLMLTLVNPSGVSFPIMDTTYLGQSLMYGNGTNVALTKNVYPVIVNNNPNASDMQFDSSYYVNIPLPEDDSTFLTAVSSIKTESIYSKHKALMISSDSTVAVRGCTAICNATNSFKVFVRDSKKQASDNLAYNNRMFRDYLSHAISLVCIPIFQKEFVIPDYLKKSFDFRMASLDSCYYARYGRPRHNERYHQTFVNLSSDANWVMPSTNFALVVKPEAIKTFVSKLASKSLTSTTQMRSSLFTREFVEPYLETNNSYYAPQTPSIFGWMFNLDNQTQHRWSYKLASAHLLRSSAPAGYYQAECGLMTNKTFGLKSIMSHVFIKTEFSGLHKDLACIRPDQLMSTDDKKQVIISSLLDIFTANFVPHDTVESAIKSWGREDYNEVVARVNQLLFLSEESLITLHALYKCESFEDLATCLDFCMPICLEMLDTLGYEKPLRDHVFAAMTYFWNITTAISKEITANGTVKE